MRSASPLRGLLYAFWSRRSRLASARGGAHIDILHILNVDKTYTSIDFLDVTFTTDTGVTIRPLESIANTTGETWTGFSFDLVAAPGASLFFTATDPSGHFGAVTPSPLLNTSFTFADGSVASGESFRPDFFLSIPVPATVTIRQTPLVDTSAVPEPGTYLLVATGLLGLVGYGWRKRKQAV